MAQERLIDVTKLVDDQKIRPFHINLQFWAVLALVSEGYDLSVMGFVGPALVRNWHISPAALGVVFSAGLVGILCGAPIFGFIGDRIGRKPAILLSVASYGVLTLVAILATTVRELTIIRFLIGLALSGVLPNTTSLVAEYAPRRLRATFIWMGGAGLIFGGAVPGWVSAAFVPTDGWHMLFVVGGALPLLVAVGLYFALPESLKYLTLHEKRHDEALRLVAKVVPALALGPETRLMVPGETRAPEFTPKRLFDGNLIHVTPYLWTMYIVAMMADYFLYSWMPTLFVSAGISPAHAALITSMYHVGGIAGGFVVCVLIDRFGLAALCGAYLVACPLAALIGVSHTSEILLAGVVTLVGFCVSAAKSGNVAVNAIIYPTGVRAKAIAWASAVSRIGSISGPLLGGWFVAMAMPQVLIFSMPALPIGLGAATAFLLRNRVGLYGIAPSLVRRRVLSAPLQSLAASDS